MTQVDIRLDTGALLECMIEQARLVVFKAVARATSITTDHPSLPSSPAAITPLSGFSTSLSLSTDITTKSMQLQKARSSALRLNNILHGKSDEADKDTLSPLGKTRKNRSVQWNHPVAVPSVDSSNFPSAKRQRMVQARLRSTKSFGRPHAEHGSGPRNATFGDFGRPDQVTWGKDGRLKNHPMPGGGLAASRLSTFHTNAPPVQNQNATFDLQSSSRGVSKASLAALGIVGDATQQNNPSMPRTATALESWLVNATKNGAASGLW